ncbi:MAG: DNA repair protein RecN [Verrucomicrobia bacterium]|nr:DNA repair protein RecN [Verrucomicrobiota bacterium]
MLISLRIKNLALASDLIVELGPGYNAITGETGAGKSLLIGGLNLVLGERADRTLIRSGADSCAVEASFDVSSVAGPIGSLLADNGLEPCEDNLLLIKRTLTSAGANRQFVNGSPTTLTTLASLGSLLVDIHGPHDHQSLLHPAQQLEILDSFGNLTAQQAAVALLVRERDSLEAAKIALIVDETVYAQQLDLLRFQATEIETAQLRPEEESEIEVEYRRTKNAVRLVDLAQSGLSILDAEEISLLTQLRSLGKVVLELRKLDPETDHIAGIHQQTMDQLAELRDELSSYTERLDIDPARVAESEDRVTLFQNLKRKYGANLADVSEFGHQARRKLAALEQRDAEVQRLNSEILQITESLRKTANALTIARNKILPKLNLGVVQQLQDLGFRQSHFEVTLSPSNMSPTGADAAEFLFAPNPGEPPQPLRAIASSGEMARVMLAIKTVLAAQDQIPLLIFDEVDANVGGETARVVGEKMQQIGKQRQVLCITHLPPVAAVAAQHFVVEKEISDGRTISKITRLDHEQRITELARMLGGQTSAARQHAEEMLRPR